MYKVICILVFVQLISANTKIDDGIKLFNEGKLQQAKKIFSKIIDEDEENTIANYYFGRILMYEGNFEDAADCFEIITENEEMNAEYHYWYGAALGQVAREASVFRQPFIVGDVKDEFLRAVELDSTFLPGRIGLASFYIQAPGIVGGDIEKGKKQAKYVLKKDSLQGASLFLSIYSAEEKWDSVDYVYEKMEKGIGDNPQMYGFYNGYGYYLLSRNRIDEAIKKFKKQVELAPANANAYDSLGDAFKAAKNYSEAEKNYRKALALDPKFETAAEHLEQLEELQED